MNASARELTRWLNCHWILDFLSKSLQMLRILAGYRVTYVCVARQNEDNEMRERETYHLNLAIDIGCSHSISVLVANRAMAYCLRSVLISPPLPQTDQNKIERHQNTWWHSGSFPLSTFHCKFSLICDICITSVRKQHIQIYIHSIHSSIWLFTRALAHALTVTS